MSVRILVVDDFKPWRLKVRSMIQHRPEWQVVGEVWDGPEAVQKAAELKPDLILMDIGLPKLNGIEAAGQIAKVSPQSKILFISQQTSAAVVEAALATGARGYVFKMDAGRELLIAIDRVLGGELFVSKRTYDGEHNGAHIATSEQEVDIGRRHEAAFYSDDRFLLDDVARFAGAALKAGNSTIILAAESHRENLVSSLQSHGLDIGAAIEQGRYVALDTAYALSSFMVDDLPDPNRFLKFFGELIEAGLEHAAGETKRVAIFGEGCGQLSAQGSPESAVQIEKLCNRLIAMYEVDILCGYSLSCFEGKQSNEAFQSICREHSAIQLR
jgi:DNA-binding NarL/FixJ family response regulator